MSWWDNLDEPKPPSPSALGLDRTYIIPVDTDPSEAGNHYSHFPDTPSDSDSGRRFWRHIRNKSNSTEISRAETWRSVASGEKWARCYSSIVLFVLSSAFISFLLMTFKPRPTIKHRISEPSGEYNDTFSGIIPIVFPHPDSGHGFFNPFTSAFPSTSPSMNFILPSFTTLTPTLEPVSAPTRSPVELPSKFPSLTPSMYPTFTPTLFPWKPPSRMPTVFPTTELTRPPTHTPTTVPTQTPSITTSMTPTEVVTTPAGRCNLPTAELWSTNSQLFNARINVLPLQSFTTFSADMCWRISPTHKAFSCKLRFNEQEDCNYISNACNHPDQTISISNITYEDNHFEFTLIENDSPVADFALFTEQDSSSPSCSFFDKERFSSFLLVDMGNT